MIQAVEDEDGLDFGASEVLDIIVQALVETEREAAQGRQKGFRLADCQDRMNVIVCIDPDVRALERFDGLGHRHPFVDSPLLERYGLSTHPVRQRRQEDGLEIPEVYFFYNRRKADVGEKYVGE